MATFTHAPKLTDLFEAALAFAASNHKYQIRKQGEIPYIAHLMAVAGLVLEAGGNEQESIAALLHDYLEDIAASPEAGAELLRDRFGNQVADYVLKLTADTVHGYLLQVNIMAPSGVQLISAADKLHNLRGYATTGRHLWNQKQSAFYATLMGTYRQCDRIPSEWISEMDFYLLELKEVV